MGTDLAATVSAPVHLHTLLLGWRSDPLSLALWAVEVVLSVAYLVGVRRLAARGRSWSPARTAAFLSGMVLVVVALQSGLAAYGRDLFWVYVIQHMLLMNFAPVLLALAAPVTLALQATNRPTQKVLLSIIHFPFIEFVTNPIFVAVAVYVTMLVYFLSPFYNFTVEHPWLHDLAYFHFFASGYLFWWLIVGRDPSRWRLSHPAKLGLLAGGIPVNAILGVSLTGAASSIAPHFHSLADTKAGGSILWVVGEIFSLVAMGLVLFQWMQFEERKAVRADRRADAESAADAASVAGASPTHNGSSGAH